MRMPVGIPRRLSSATAWAGRSDAGCAARSRARPSRRASAPTAHAHLRALGDLQPQVLVAQQGRGLGEDRARVPEVAHPPPRCRASACSGPRPTRTGRSSCPSRCAWPPHDGRASSARSTSGTLTLTMISSRSTARVEFQVLVRRAPEAVVADNPVGDEVARAGRDVVSGNSIPSGSNGDHARLRVRLQSDTIDRPFVVVADRSVEAPAAPSAAPDTDACTPFGFREARPRCRFRAVEASPASSAMIVPSLLEMRSTLAAAPALGVEDPPPGPLSPLLARVVRPATVSLIASKLAHDPALIASSL